MTALPPVPPANMNKAHAGAAVLVVSVALTKIINRFLTLKFPTFWNEDMADALGTIIDGGLTWYAVYKTPGA